MVFAWRGDNAGPPDSVEEIIDNFADIQKAFPGAAVFASTFDNFTQHVVGNASLYGALPTITSEIADTWLHGAASVRLVCKHVLLFAVWLKFFFSPPSLPTTTTTKISCRTPCALPFSDGPPCLDPSVF